jgi:hypothetical protein
MNKDLLQFIELCLIDGVLSDKEREVIFRKSREFGIPDDECEIILEGLILRHGLVQSTQEDVSIEDHYFDDIEYKSWFVHRLEAKKELDNIKSRTSEIIRNYIHKHIDGSENNGSKSGDYIKRETILKICELEEIPDIPDTFWKKGVIGQKGSLEFYFRDEIKNTLLNERFICYLSGSKSGFGSLGYSWGDSDLNQMIDNYYFPDRDLGNSGWYAVKKNRFSIEYEREGILFTNKSVLELKEGGKNEPPKLKRTDLNEIGIDFFLDEFGYFRTLFNAIGGIFESDAFDIKELLPRPIVHNNDIFLTKINKIGISEYTKRIIRIDEQIESFVNDNYNSKIAKSNYNYLYGFGTKKNTLGVEKVVIRENGLLGIHELSLEFFSAYLKALTFRDSLLNQLLLNRVVDLEGALVRFENSVLGMSKYEKGALSLLESINHNIVELKEVTEAGLSEVNSNIGLVVSDLNELNASTKQVLSSLATSNFINLVGLYQNYLINRSIQSLEKSDG